VFPEMSAGPDSVSVEMSNGIPLLQASQAGKYVAVDDKGHSYVSTLAGVTTNPIKAPWNVAFTPGWGAPAEVKLDRLASWTESNDDNIRHYSGTASYTTFFSITSASLSRDAIIQLNLGEVRETARVWVNGRELGVLWKQPFAIDISTAVMAGTNTVRVDVTNLWPNRIIGDQSLPQEKRFTHTNITKFAPATPLLPSGLLGPVQVRTIQVVPMVPM